MKKLGFFVLFGGIFLIIFIIDFVVSSQVNKRNFRKENRLALFSIISDSTKVPLSEFRRTNYEIKPKPIYTYDEDGELEVEYAEYDRSYYRGGYKGGSYSGGK
ncbi:MAG: hypothetical protein KatS3mg035_1178 [Bacteroidia bacterium]|nr:MAG: hypothetical protein KatS3mg035_1178 [Bacteroidia bacterium]